MAKIASNGIRYGTFEAPRSTTESRIRWRNPEIKIPLLMVSPPASRYLLSKEGALSDWFQPEQIFCRAAGPCLPRGAAYAMTRKGIVSGVSVPEEANFHHLDFSRRWGHP